MKVINFGSLNIDYVYQVEHMVKPGETLTAKTQQVFAGGKGLNQSIAIARAGGEVIHAGVIGEDGAFLQQLLSESGADASRLLHVGEATGHAVIQVNPQGQNAILVYGGANHRFTEAYVAECLTLAEKGDYVLLQNETNCIEFIMRNARQKGLRAVFNPSPFSENIAGLPLDCVHTFMLNEIEGAAMAGLPEDSEPSAVFDSMVRKYPSADIVLTLGSRGVMAQIAGKSYFQSIFRVQPVDTTAAGDTFCGYYLASACLNLLPEKVLLRSAAAAALAITKQGAAPSIPLLQTVEGFLKSMTIHN